MNLLKVVGVAAVLGSASISQAVVANWTDWVSTDTSSTVSGTLLVGSTSVDVDFSATSPYNFVQTAGGTNYWVPSTPYDSGEVENAPPTPDIISLSAAGTVTLSFSEPVLDPYIALVSWNSNTVVFDTPIEIVSFGAGYWGSGTPILNDDGDGFFGSGEVHGVIKAPGVHQSISFTHLGENWHGLTVGVAGLPEPSSAALIVVSILGAGAFRRR